MNMSLTRVLVATSLAVSLAAVLGCSSTKIAEAPVVTPPVASTPPATSPPPISPNAGKSPVQSTVTSVVVQPLDDPKSPLAIRSIYFEYDSAQLAPASTQLLAAHGNYLRSHGSAKVRLEGNADERGGREYNLALGQRRSDAVAQALKLVGVIDSQMEAISYGKEKPVAIGHDETAWAKNRRADIVYQAR